MGEHVGALCCWRCTASLASLSLPLSRMDVCPECGIDVHVCRQCMHYDRAIVQQCRIDDADEVKEKDRRNFCDWFQPGANDWQGESPGAKRSENELDRLFGDAGSGGSAGDDDDDAPDNPLDALFRD